MNEKKSTSEKEPARIVGVSLGIFVDGIWNFVYDEKGDFVIENGMRKREYKPMALEEIKILKMFCKVLLNISQKEAIQ